MPSSNRAIIAAAGSGKTTTIVEEAIRNPHRKIAILTYTINNLSELRRRFYQYNGTIPDNVFLFTWFQFLLRDCARPYQNFVYDRRRIQSIAFVSGRSALYVKKDDVSRYFFSHGCDIYTDKLAEFACICDQRSGGFVVSRLSKMYDCIFVDEVQDLAGYDLELLKLLLQSDIDVFLVGDYRQATFSTNNAAKHSRYKGAKIIDLFRLWDRQGLCRVTYDTKSYRCNQMICDLADGLFPDAPRTESQNRETVGHDGLFSIPEGKLDAYMSRFSPVILRYDRRTNCRGYYSMNFGDSKGLSFDRILIIPNGPISRFLSSGSIDHVKGSVEKFYVALTRARYSIAFLYDSECANRSIAVYSDE